MSHKKKRRSIIDELFGGSPFSDTESFFDNFPEWGYSISVVQTLEGTKVKAKAGKDTTQTCLENNSNKNIQTQK